MYVCTDKLSMSEHVQVRDVVVKCACTVIACYQSIAPTWYERPVSASCVQIRCPRQTTLRVQLLTADLSNSARVREK